MVVLDTVRKDYFKEYFGWLSGISYDNAFSTANWTVPAHASLFSGKYPSEIGVHAKNPSLNSKQTVLPEKLVNAGYHTSCLTANLSLTKERNWDRGFVDFHGQRELLFPNDSRIVDWREFDNTHSDKGAMKYFYALKKCVKSEYNTIPSIKRGMEIKFKDLSEVSTVSDWGAQTVRDICSESTFSGDQFLFVNLMEAHTPYYPPEDYRTTDEEITISAEDSFGEKEMDSESISAAYESSIKYLSDIYKEIYELLIDDFDYVITMSDHGELLGEHGNWNHITGIYPELTNIPIVISGNVDDMIVQDPISILDLHKTIADLTEVSVDSRGRNILGEFEEQPLFTEYHGLIPIAVRNLQKSEISQTTIENVDQYRAGIVDTEGHYTYEKVGGIVGNQNSKQEKRVVSQIREFKERIGDEGNSDSEEELSEDVKSRLEDLGYA